MPCINFPNQAAGPSLQIGFSVSAATRAPNSPKPNIHWVNAIADTGCTMTSVYTAAASAAGLQILSKTMVNSTTHSVAANVYIGDLWLRLPLPNGSFFDWAFPNRGFIELLQSNAGCEALLGMDILASGFFSVNGLSRTSTFCW